MSDQQYYCSILIVAPSQNRVVISFSSVTLASFVVDVLPPATNLSIHPTVYVPGSLTSLTVFGRDFDVCDSLIFKCHRIYTHSIIVSSSVAIVEAFLNSRCENAIFSGSCISEISFSLLPLSPLKVLKISPTT